VVREHYVEADGTRRARVSIVTSVRTMKGWARDRSVGIKRGELRAIIRGLELACDMAQNDERQEALPL
jgi:hypothetical protein